MFINACSKTFYYFQSLLLLILNYDENILYSNYKQYSLKGIIQETPMSNLFFSDMNTRTIQWTIRYRIFKEKNKTISFQSEKDMFIIMRSIYLQYGNSIVTSDKML